MRHGVPRILIIRLSAIGDVIRVLPALHALRDLHPHAQIDWAVEPKAAAILEDHPALDQLHLFDRTGTAMEQARKFKDFCARLRAERYDIVLDFHGILKSGVMARATGAKLRYGFAPPRAQEMSHWFINRKVKLPRARMNRMEENLALCRAVGAEWHGLDVHIEIPEEIEDEVHDFLEAAFDAGKQLVVVHAPVDRPEKQWPLTHFSALCDLLLADGRFEVLLTCGPGQRAVAQAVCDASLRKPVLAPELPTLKHLAAVLKAAGLFFGGDTGPMHLASALGVPVVAVFGGTDPTLHAPLRLPSAVLDGGPQPRPRAVDTVHGATWLAGITPDQAYAACISVLLQREIES
jgi:lipopolysaccharide heptosyltransferase I